MHEISCLKTIITEDGMFLQNELNERNVSITFKYLKFKHQRFLTI